MCKTLIFPLGHFHEFGLWIVYLYYMSARRRAIRAGLKTCSNSWDCLLYRWLPCIKAWQTFQGSCVVCLLSWSCPETPMCFVLCDMVHVRWFACHHHHAPCEGIGYRFYNVYIFVVYSIQYTCHTYSCDPVHLSAQSAIDHPSSTLLS